MPNYRIAIYEGKEARIIDLDRIIEITRLKKLDEFTSGFVNEEELKAYLFNKGLISLNELRNNLCIVYRYKNQIKRIPIIYKDMKKYLNTKYLDHKIQAFSQNLETLEKLVKMYSFGDNKSNPQKYNILHITAYINTVKANDGKHFYSEDLIRALKNLCEMASTRLIKETGELKENYRGCRDLGMFLYKSADLLAKKEQKQKINNKKETVIQYEWEQNSLFDFDVENDQNNIENNQDDIEAYRSEDWPLVENEEPYFPPNSEEEMEYIKYLDELEEKANNEPIENHPHYKRH